MPKAAPPDSCATCLRRKVKCDGGKPICKKCAVKNRDCVRPPKEHRFVVHGRRSKTTEHIHPSGEDSERNSPRIIPAEATAYTSSQSLPIDRCQYVANSNPTQALHDPEVAKLFAHYIDVLAPWYDLNDPNRTFATTVVETALCKPILFKSIIAFSACHWSKTKGCYAELAAVFHAACVVELLQSLESQDLESHASKLAATCLLRSYELINGGSETESHLLGAFSYAIQEPIDFSEPGILQIGAWNYLREEITVGLMQRRAVRIGQIFEGHMQTSPERIHPSDRVSYLLAQILNFCFAEESRNMAVKERRIEWCALRAHLTKWKEDLPAGFGPFTFAKKPGNPFPSLWMLQPWHVAAQQYCAISEILLAIYDPCPEGGHLSRRNLDFAEEQALRVCGLAWTNENDAARVNAFGPMAFCGRFLSLRRDQDALEELLLKCSLPTGWPVDEIIKNLKSHWDSEY